MTTERIITSKRHFGLNLRELWHYRELLYFFAWRDYKVRYKQTFIGILWAVFQPLATMAAFVLFFGRFKEISATGVPYVLFVYSGLVLWQFFSNAISDSSASLVSNSSLVTKVYFPKILIPAAPVLVQYVDLLFSGFILFCLMLYFHYLPPITVIIFIIPLILLLTLLSAGIGIFLSALNVKYRDVRYILPFFIQLLLFFSPIIYSSSNLGKFTFLLKFNPLTGIIEAFRAALFGLPFPTGSFLISCGLSLGIFLCAFYYFSRSQDAFADLI